MRLPHRPHVVFEVRDGHVERRTLEPEDFAIHRANADDLKGGDKARNLEIATPCSLARAVRNATSCW